MKKIIFLSLTALAAMAFIALPKANQSKNILIGMNKRSEKMSTVTITNKYWNRLTLQVREGNSSSIESNPEIFNRTLSRGETVSFNFNSMLFYRRDANPDSPNGQFTGWTQCFSSQNIDNP
jgi:hypothetical protein